MSVPELCARLEDLVAAIQTQKAVLEDLERTKTDVLRQLNHLRDPITRLPPEITSEIFLQCLPVPNEGSHPSTAALLLLNICSSWTDRALSTGALWTELALEVPRNSTIQYQEHVARSLARAHGQPSSLFLSGYAEDDIVATVARHALQLRKLRLQTGSELFYTETTYPALNYLSIGSSNTRLNYWDVEDFAQIFRAAPGLVELECSALGLRNNDGRHATHLGIQSLRIVGGTTGRALDFFTLPSLQRLHFMCRNSSGPSQLSAFLTRSSPPLEGLSINSYDMLWALHSIDKCFCLIPTLTHLVLSGPSGFHEAFFTNLADSPSCLPNLLDLTTNVTSLPDDAWYEGLGAMLSIRRSDPRVTVKLQLFHLECDESNGHPHGTNIKAITKALVADGMVITGMEQ
ncbi:hypothetical protein C8R44DRAFT_977540 [Mycena epipterygia]|nr:hypothetical protein C8R44DRAFT_977540 [Mycena epipterygia]